MDILILVLAIAIGATMTLGYQAAREWRKVRIARSRTAFTVAEGVPYDTAIDRVTDNGLERLQLHRATTDPTVRARMKGTPLYERAAPILGWEL